MAKSPAQAKYIEIKKIQWGTWCRAFYSLYQHLGVKVDFESMLRNYVFLALQYNGIPVINEREDENNCLSFKVAKGVMISGIDTSKTLAFNWVNID